MSRTFFFETGERNKRLKKCPTGDASMESDGMTNRFQAWLASQPKKPKLWILTPCYGSQVYVSYVADIMKTRDVLERAGISVVVEFCRNDSLVPRARNNLLARAMSDPDMTHALFIDADIHWSPVGVLQLLLADKPIVGGAYPQKRYNWSELAANPVPEFLTRHEASLAKGSTTPADYIRHNLVRYNVNFASTTMDVVDSLVEVRHAPTGFLLLQRGAVEALQGVMPAAKYVDDVGYLTEAEQGQAYALFDCGVVDGHYYSEDWMLCHRWSTLCGGKVYIHICVPLTHTGVEDYAGFLLSSLS